ncbi:hypothetical protein [Cryptosporangium phraense]|uniref:Uncharacterized protein n=1 Tax=Cryptosporangium phraense TaxID=2593070 RepID=A0A545AXP5_9ACTN|nr:hypothetical protein [Cryptosporangium phraense]TQS46102.1 hypothetical protein FL583_06365 [Cryptosporangium phraense]
MDETRTRALLAEISADPAPPTGVDLDRVVALGRRRRHRPRQWVAAAAAAAVVIVTAVVFFRPTPADRPAPVVTAPVAAPTTFNPLRTLIEPGWLPHELTQRIRNVTLQHENYLATGQGSEEITIDLAVPGATSPLYGGAIASPVAGPDVNGAPSTWTAGSSRGGPDSGWLTWDWAPGATAIVRVLGFDDPRAIAVRVASSLRVGGGKPMAMPFTVARPDGLALIQSRIEHLVGAPHVGIAFNGERGVAHAVSVGLEPGTPAGDLQENATVAGRSARVDAGSLEVRISQHSGSEVLTVSCQVRKGSTVAAVRAECERVIGSVQRVGTFNTESTWSTSPVR